MTTTVLGCDIKLLMFCKHFVKLLPNRGRTFDICVVLLRQVLLLCRTAESGSRVSISCSSSPHMLKAKANHRPHSEFISVKKHQCQAHPSLIFDKGKKIGEISTQPNPIRPHEKWFFNRRHAYHVKRKRHLTVRNDTQTPVQFEYLARVFKGHSNPQNRHQTIYPIDFGAK